VTTRNPNIEVGAKVPSSHGPLLKKDAPAIATAVHDVAGRAAG
jgi:hypothetical protein